MTFPHAGFLSTCCIPFHLFYQHAVYQSIFNMPYTNQFSTCRIPIDFQHAVYISIFNMPYIYRFSTCRILIHFQHAVNLSIFNMPYTYQFSTCRIPILTCRIFNMFEIQLFEIQHAVCSFLARNMPF